MASTAEVGAWAKQVERWRNEKDGFLGGHPESPLREPDRDSLDGLSYYPPDPGWAVEADARRAAEGDPIEVAMTRGAPRQYLRYAKAAFTAPDGSACEVTLYHEPHDHHGHAPHEPHRLFLPFRDATSGATTYGAGRYLEVANPFDAGDETADLVIDFNFAYSPFCAYNEEYACPLPPRENWLRVAVEAGEKHGTET